MNTLVAASVVLGLGLAVTSLRAEIPVVPRPAHAVEGKGSFQLTADVRIAAPAAARAEADYLAALLRAPTGFKVPVSEKSGAPISLQLERGAAPGPEAYHLDVSSKGVTLRAATREGLFYGIQTLRQLLPPAIESRKPVAGTAWTVPAVVIDDEPRFRWRGAMLDVCRHMLAVDDIKKFIDLMALQKLNTLHWHLTDDQGWRIEIKKYPKLTEIGSWRAESPKPGNRNEGDGTRYGGFFTQDQVRDIVAYAASRHITVVPEIEMPGHAVAALSGYPELGCTGGPYAPRTRWGVMADVFCAGNDATYRFMEDVLSEVTAMFPSTFIHVGGDECPKDRWNTCPKCQQRMKDNGLKNAHELQSYFVRHFDQWLAAHGRRLIGWDEILEGGLAPGAAVMSWRGIKGGIEAAKSGHDVVMSPTSHLYLDYAQAKGPGEPEAIGGFVPLRQVYSYDPVPAELTPAEAKHVLGAQGNLWAEYLRNIRDVEYFAFPRLLALSEVAWTPQADRQYADFLARLPNVLERLDRWGVNYRKVDDVPPAAQWKSGELTDVAAEHAWDVTPAMAKPGTYEIRFQYTHGTHRLDIEWAALLAGGKEVARDAHAGVTGSRDEANVYQLRVPAGAMKPLLLRARVRADGGADSNGDIRIRRTGD